MKNFNDWNQVKNFVEQKGRPPFFRERQVWLVYCGENIGSEQCGRGKKFLRPMLILKKFNNRMCWAIPLTTKNKDHQLLSYMIEFKDQKNWLLTQQLKLVDSKRFITCTGSISSKKFEAIHQHIQTIFCSNYKQELKTVPVDSLMAKCTQTVSGTTCFVNLDIDQINFSKLNGLVPAIVQDVKTGTVLMLGFQNREACIKTLEEQKITFWSRTKKKLWTKGETSGDFLLVQSVELDCDNDTLLYQVVAPEKTCHTGKFSCFGGAKNFSFLDQLFALIQDRKKNRPTGSYVASLFDEGLDRMAQKVGEEGVEVVIAAKNNDDADFIGEAADLVFHLQVLCAAKNIAWDQVADRLRERHKGE